MKAADRRRGSDNKERNRRAQFDSKERKPQAKNGGRNLKAKEIDAKPVSDKPNTNISASDLKTGVEPPEIHENMTTDYVEDLYKSEEQVLDTGKVRTDVKLGNENFSDTSSAMEIAGDSDAESTYDSVSSKGDSHTADEEKTESLAWVVCKSNNPQTKASKNTPKKGDKPKKGISKLATKGSFDNLKSMKVHPKPLSDSSEGADGQRLELYEGINIRDNDTSNGRNVSTDDGVVNSEDNYDQEDQGVIDQKIEEMEVRIKNLESELREVAALEIALYSVVPEHGSSAHKVHTPARRLSRLYIYACKYWPQDKRATVARNTVSGLVLVSKSCSNDVSRLTFWLSNTVVLREVISQTFGSSCQSSSLANLYESKEGGSKSSPFKWKNTNRGGKLNKQGLLQFVDDWEETRTFTSALEKVKSWIFLRIVESIWWQTLMPNMQSTLADSATNKGTEKLLGPALSDQEQGNFSINLWKNAFHNSLKRLCPVRAGGHECGCLPVLARKVMEQCINRLDVAMFNAILRESAHEIPTDPVSDPILDSKVLPIPAGCLSFGSGAQLKNGVGNWARWMSDFLGIDAESSAKDENLIQKDDDDKNEKDIKIFPLLNELSDLLMLPKDMLMDSTIRMEVCPSISLPLVKRILCNFSPDEFCPDPVPGTVLEALNAECIIENTLSGESNSSFPHVAAPITYTPPSSSEVSEAGANSKLSRSASTVQRKGYTSDEELDELESCLTLAVDTFPSTPTKVTNGSDRSNARYDLLRQVWKAP